MRIRRLALAGTILAGFFAVSCSSNLGSFDVMSTDPNPVEHPLDVKRAETADQGSADARAAGGHRVRRSTVGGTYLRRPSTSGESAVRSGLHGSPDAP